jgi:hypothetical protein
MSGHHGDHPAALRDIGYKEKMSFVWDEEKERVRLMNIM